MTVIEARIHVAAGRAIAGDAPVSVPEGDHEAVILLASGPRRRIADLPVHPSGWDASVPLRREDLYSDAVAGRAGDAGPGPAR